MRYQAALLILASAWIIPAHAQVPPEESKHQPKSAAGKTAKAPKSEVEEYRQGIADHLTLVRKQMLDPAFPLARREAIAAETLAYLRTQVAEAPNPVEALAVWARLIDLARE